ncbi:MAG: sigma-70 family RNA polymerase sigma factor [Myxococcota bacterium]
MAGDAELLQAWRSGDRAAGSELFEKYIDLVSRFLQNKVGAEREDLIQRTFLACVESRDRIREGSTFAAYLLRVARSKLIDHYRAKAGTQFDALATSVADFGESPSAVVSRAERDRLLLLALRAIPFDLQIALELYYWEGMGTPALAEVLELPPGTVRSRLHRARELLLEELRTLLAATPGAEGHDPADLGDLDAWARSVRAAAPDDAGV